MSKLKRRTETCYCKAYNFPHRIGSGKCQGLISSFSENYICTCCGNTCTLVERDVGIGYYEYWGCPGRDVDIRSVSDCCEADALPNNYESFREMK